MSSCEWGHDELDPAALALLYALPTSQGGGCAGLIELFSTGIPIPIMGTDNSPGVPIGHSTVWHWEIQCGGNVVAQDGPMGGILPMSYPLPGGATLTIWHNP